MMYEDMATDPVAISVLGDIQVLDLTKCILVAVT